MSQINSKEVVKYILNNPNSSSSDIFKALNSEMSLATVKRVLNKLKNDNIIVSTGKAKATRYSISPYYKLFANIDMQEYYKKEIDQRDINKNFNFILLSDILPNVNIFTDKELAKLQELQNGYTNNIANMTTTEYNKEIERLAIDLSWKSSQIEGNTYSLLETERLLKEKQTASGKTKDEAIMLLNHKEAIDFIVENQDFLTELSLQKIEYIHSILTKELNVDKNIRKRKVGISGTNYTPIDNEYQIKEAMQQMCNIVNQKQNPFQKALLTLLLISYIQPFADGNKPTARIVSNAILLAFKYCPISFRTVDSLEYKKAMLLFYEQNNISNFKIIFIDQYQFAVDTYF